MRKAFFPGVVSASPTVCTQNARKVTAASTSPALRHGPFSVPASERWNTAAMRSPVEEEAHADELGRGQHVHGVLHHHEGEPPNNGGRQQHELVHEARDMSLLSHSLPL